MRLVAAVVAGKMVASLSRRLNVGGGTTFPGDVLRRIDPAGLEKMAGRLAKGSIVVTGTNGKTTTTRMISSALQAAGLRPIHNRSGANLIAGVTSAMLNAANLGGFPQGDIGLFEVDEANLPAVASETKPAVVVINNLFRDQLDRYGEVDYVASLWRQALASLGPSTCVVLNADDPLVASLSAAAHGPVLYFGVEDERYGRTTLEHAADAKNCVQCGSRYTYSVAFYGHVGKYACPNCGARRPTPDVAAARVSLNATAGSELTVITPRGALHLQIGLPGMYNVYNALAAVAGGVALGLPLVRIGTGLSSFAAAFGRVERIPAGDKTIFLALVKNPTGFNEVLRTLMLDADQRDLLIIINDNIADGTDISWLWDVDFEVLQGRVESVVVAGTRAEDMALRLKYALVDPERVRLEKDLSRALDAGLSNVEPGGTLYVLPTYTAMLEIRQVIERLGLVGKFWQD